MKSVTDTNIILDERVDEIIDMAIKEDVLTGDITTENIISDDRQVYAVIAAKENGVIAGLTVAERVFKYFNRDISFSENYKDGDPISAGDEIVKIGGSYKAVLIGERTALNFLQRMSGIVLRSLHSLPRPCTSPVMPRCLL